MKNIALILIVLLSSLSHAASTVVSYDNYADVDEHISQFIDDETLVVFDIDDTLFHAPNCLPNGGEDIPPFIRWKVIVETCPYGPTEDYVVSMIEELQANGIDTMALTARDGKMIELTQTHLETLGIDFADKPFGPEFDFTEQVTKKRKLYFRSGVAWASGTSKGNALRLFQEKIFPKPYSKIVFIDDNDKYVRSVAAAFRKDDSVDALIIHYTRFDD